MEKEDFQLNKMWPSHSERDAAQKYEYFNKAFSWESFEDGARVTLNKDLRGMGDEVQILVLLVLSLCTELEQEHKTEMRNYNKISNPIKVSIRHFNNFCFCETSLGFNHIGSKL